MGYNNGYKKRHTFWISDGYNKRIKDLLKFTGWDFENFLYYCFKNLDTWEAIHSAKFKILFDKYHKKEISKEKFFEVRDKLFNESLTKRVIIR